MRNAPALFKIFSYFFMFMGVVAVGALAVAWNNPSEASRLSVTFLTTTFGFSDSPVLYSATCLFFVLAGVLGLSIIARRSYAYDLGIAYCVIGLVFFDTLIIAQIGLIQHRMIGLVIQSAIFGGFLTYLIRHRREWRSGAKSEPPKASAQVSPMNP